MIIMDKCSIQFWNDIKKLVIETFKDQTYIKQIKENSDFHLFLVNAFQITGDRPIFDGLQATLIMWAIKSMKEHHWTF